MMATMPECSGLESIGSVAANFARTAEEDGHADYQRMVCGALGDILLQSLGPPTYEKYANDMRWKLDKERKQADKDNARRAARKAACKKLCGRCKKVVRKVAKVFACGKDLHSSS